MYKVLDLFCGAGGAAMGLHRAWADAEIIGVDIHPQPRYPFHFVQGDALHPPFDLKEFDFIWASPPCQGYSVLTPKSHKGAHPRLIYDVRAMLKEAGKPFVIENVHGARRHLDNYLMLCGSMFGLRTERHRYFEIQPMLSFWLTPTCRHDEMPLLVTTASKASRAKRIEKGLVPKSVTHAPLAYGIDWMNAKELCEAIPPAYSEYIARQIRPGA